MLDIDNNQKPDNELLSLKNEFVNLCDEFPRSTITVHFSVNL